MGKISVSKHQYADLKPADFDKYDCVKISPLIYLALILVLKAYIVWLLTVTNMQDRLSIIQFFYPDKSVFFVNLASGVIGLLALLVLTMRRPEAPVWVQRIWPKFRLLIVIAMLFDVSVNIFAVWFWGIGHYQWVIVSIAIDALVVVCLFNSKRTTINLKEFPEKLPE